MIFDGNREIYSTLIGVLISSYGHLSGAAANPKNWIKPTTIRGALTGKMAKCNYIDEAIGFPFITGGNTANKLLFK